LAERCEDVVKRLFPKEDFEIREVIDYSKLENYGPYCLVDYKDRHVEADIDIDTECEAKCDYDEEDEECFDECVKELTEIVDKAEVGSFYFDKDTLSLNGAATIPVNCRHVWAEEYDDDPVPFDERLKKLEERFDQIGCHLVSDWIHGHELAGTGEVDTSPAMCYLHPYQRGKCKVDAVLRIVRDLRLERV